MTPRLGDGGVKGLTLGDGLLSDEILFCRAQATAMGKLNSAVEKKPAPCRAVVSE